jgi:antimicrobial peptide system SdpB family protein
MSAKKILFRFVRKPKFGFYLGIVRSLLAISLLATILLTGKDRLFFYQLHADVNPDIYDVKYGILTQYSIFNLLDINLAYYLTILVLLVVISGYFSRLSSILHFYICFSFVSSTVLVNGGNKISLVLTLLLIPICFLENRKNHWIEEAKPPNFYRDVGLNIVLLFARLQICYIYFQTFYKKLEVHEWSNGTVLWYYLQKQNHFEADSGLRRMILDVVLYNDKLLVISTWSVLLVELLLALTLFFKQRDRIYLFLLGLLLHLSIAVFLGLFAFAIVMISALLLLTFPLNFERLKIFRS